MLSCQFVSAQQERKVCWNSIEEPPGEHHTRCRQPEPTPANTGTPSYGQWALTPNQLLWIGHKDSYVWILQNKQAMKSEGLGLILSGFGNC